MICLAIVSDTHWQCWDEKDPDIVRLSQRLAEDNFDAIWHAGDVVSDEVLKGLEAIAHLTCVKGNCDGRVQKKLPYSVRLTIDGVRLAMLHGWDLPLGHPPSLTGCWKEPVDIVIHGHTHRQRFETVPTSWGECTIINPGSPSEPRGTDTAGFGRLMIENSRWSYERIELT